MENIREKAEIYAEGKVNEVLTQAVANAYMDGYRDGYKDCEDSIPVDLRNGLTEFVDLGLPSGTLWAKDYERNNDEILYLPHGEANRFDIPTEEQWEELERECMFEFKDSEYGFLKSAECIGPNGNVIVFEKTGMITSKETYLQAYMWLKDESDERFRNAGRIVRNRDQKVSKTEKANIFQGYKLPIRLVKQSV